MPKEFAFCSVSLSPLRAKAEDSSELVSQLVFGESVQILEKQNQWRRVKSLVDRYEGWLDEKCISVLTEKENRIWENGRKPIYNAIATLESNEGLMYLTRGAFISQSMQNFQIGNKAYKLISQVEDIPESLVEISNSYLNAPYLWGGKTLFGIDCSGLTQMVFRLRGIDLSRDANTQAKEGKEIPFSERQAGDLAFFVNENGKIHHVGIIKNENEIIHAHGWVRTDKLDDIGILGRSKLKYSHKLTFIKRFV